MLCAVIGNPIQHSVSPQMYARFNQNFCFDLKYLRIKSPLHAFSETVSDFQRRGGAYLNVTLPFKTEAYALATRHSERAQQSQSVSLLRLTDAEDIYGDTFDGFGLVTDIEKNWSFDLAAQNVLVLGAGGAAREAVVALKNAGAEVFVCNRSEQKAHTLAETFSVTPLPFSALTSVSFSLLINATSSSLQKIALPLPEKLFHPALYCYDLAYHPSGETYFLAQAAALGAKQLRDGLGMLLEQGARVFQTWFQVMPDTKHLIRHREWLYEEN